jgi:hypothetical protein
MLRALGRVTGVVLLALAAPAAAGPDASSLIFQAPALADLPTGTTMVYRLDHTVSGGAAGAGRASSTSTVELSLHGDTSGGRQARIEIVTSERRQDAGTFPSTAGNPVVLLVLERDVTDMSRVLRGSPYYIRNRIREALGNTTPAEPTRLTFGGRELEGWQVTVSPFMHDRNRDKLREHAARRYEFTFADAVPGGLYAIRLVTPAVDGGALAEDRLVLEAVRSLGGGSR